MHKTDLTSLPCPIARSLGVVGEWWSILILREAMYGETRFDGFQKSLGIAPNMLTRRLNELVAAGLLARRQYSEKPPRHEYLLTEAGADFRQVTLAMLAWGNKHFAPEGKSVILVDSVSGEEVHPLLMDPATGVAIGKRHVVAAGPAASESTRSRMRRLADRQAAAPTPDLSTGE